MKKFRDMNLEERRRYLEEISGKNFNSLETDLDTLNRLVENVIGRITLPVGVVFGKINGVDRIIFLAIEEPSVIAAANKAFKLSDWVIASYSGSIMIGTIYLKTDNSIALIQELEKIKDQIDLIAKTKLQRLEKYKGGYIQMNISRFDNIRGEFVKLEFLINVGDAMGANIVNSFLEDISIDIEKLIGQRAILRILSNFSIHRKVYIKARWGEKLKEEIQSKGLDYKEQINRFLDVISIAHSDIYRKTTYNKGTMNGISAAALAYGQDWRAIEAGIHSYTNYLQIPLVNYWEQDGAIYGSLEAPIAVGSVGGSVKSLNHAKTLMEISNIKDSGDLAMLIGAVGLANNFGANLHLTIEGIQKGHMKLHARNIAISIGAVGDEIDKLVDIMIKDGKYSYEYAQKMLEMIRHDNSNS